MLTIAVDAFAANSFLGFLDPNLTCAAENAPPTAQYFS